VAALKIAQKVTGLYEVVGLAHSFHGSTSGAGASTLIPSRRAGDGPTPAGDVSPSLRPTVTVLRHVLETAGEQLCGISHGELESARRRVPGQGLGDVEDPGSLSGA